MSHLTDPIATASQLSRKHSTNALPLELQESIRYYAARLTQAAGFLLQLSQDITAQANVLLYRYWLVDDLMEHEFSDVSAAVLYLTCKVSAFPRSPRSIANVYNYLLSPQSGLSTDLETAKNADPNSYYVSEGSYLAYRNKLLHVEGQVLNALGFNTHVALPHPQAITYLQTLGVFSSDLEKDTKREFAKQTIAYLNTALLSPQMLYLTHQPCALATAAIYLAARDKAVKLPDVEWWEVFDCEREELGFLVVAMGSLEGLVRRERERWGSKGMITRSDVREELSRLSIGNGAGVEDDEAEMARLMDEKVGAV